MSRPALLPLISPTTRRGKSRNNMLAPVHDGMDVDFTEEVPSCMTFHAENSSSKAARR